MQSTTGTSSSTARPCSLSYNNNNASRRRSSVPDQQSSLDNTSTCDDANEPPRRSSAFLEVGLGGDDPIVDAKLRREARPKLSVRFRSKVDIVEPEVIDDCDTSHYDYSRREMPFFFPTLPRLLFLALVIVLIVPSLHTSPLLQVDANPVQPRAGAFEANLRRSNTLRGLPHQKKADTPTTICKRWSQQSALVNGTLYLYSGRSTSSASQDSDTWSAYSPRGLLLHVIGCHADNPDRFRFSGP